MDKIAFDGVGEMVVTLPVAEGVTEGVPVKLDAGGTAAPCAAGERFCGVALAPKGGFGAVQVGGFTALPCADETVTAGWVSLAADGNGGVKKAGAGEGAEYLVVQTEGGMVSLLL